MKKITLFGSILVFMLVTITAFPSVISEGKTIYVDDDGDADYTRIQDAVDAASDGDTIYVYSGIYYENVKINKSIILQGEDKENTIVHGGGFGSGDGVILVKYSDNVEITGFAVRNSCPYWPGSGIGLYNAEQCIVTDNIVYDCCIGIHAFITSDVTISKNTITNSKFGIRIQKTKFSTITRNTMQDNEIGMDLNAAYNNEIIENNFINNEKQVYFQIVILNKIDSNYWEPSINIIPKPIFGILFFIIPGFLFDWNPASEPYDID